MQSQGRKRRTLSVALIVLAWLAIGLSTPIVISLYSTTIAPDAVEASPRDVFAIAQPVLLLEAPLVRVERGTIVAVDAAGKPIQLTLPSGAGTSLAPGGSAPIPPSVQHLLLDNATITIGARARGASPGELLAPLVQALSAARYDTLSLRRSTLVIELSEQGGETISDLRAEITLRRKAGAIVKGSGLFRGQRVSFDVATGMPTAERRPAQSQQAGQQGPAGQGQAGQGQPAQGDVAPGQAQVRVPIKLSIKGALIECQLDGRLLAGGTALELHGQGELAAGSGRQIARWFGAYWASGPGLRDIAIKGQVSLAAGSLAFEKAVVRMDGNEATGALAIRLARPRPQISGTLAYKTLDARPYLAKGVGEPQETFSWASLAGGALTVPLGMHLDADLRLSAGRILLAGLELGSSAATVALKDGRLLADLAELRFNGGIGRGQVGADFTGFAPKVTIRGKLDNVDLGTLSTALAGLPLVQAPATIVADLGATGGTLHELARAMAGRVMLRSQQAGRLNVDLKALSASVQGREASGWGEAVRGTTAFDVLDLKLVLRDGIVLTETAELQSGEGLWSATGVLNLPANRLDVRLTQASPAQGAGTGTARATAPARPTVIELHGPWAQPTIKSLAEIEATVAGEAEQNVPMSVPTGALKPAR